MEISDGDDKLFASCLLPLFNIGMTVAVFKSSGRITYENDF